MEMCRACLSTGLGMIPMDEVFVDKYNNLTNLNVSLSEQTPLYTCCTCYNDAVFCIDFRKKCIVSDQTLREMLIQKNADETKSFQPEVKVAADVAVKLKVELECDDTNNFSEGCNNNDDDDELQLKNKTISTRKGISKTDKKTKLLKNVDSSSKCGLCNEQFTDKEGLIKHLESHKEDTVCSRCPQRFSNWLHILSHRIEHLPQNCRRCHICLKFFHNETNLEFHLMRVHELAEKDAKIKCKMCASTHTTGKKLNKHILHAHSPPGIKCETCGKCFRTLNRLKGHQTVHLTEKLYACDMCEFSTKWENSLKKHKLCIHTKGRVYCQKCGTVSKNEEKLKLHVCTQTSTICPICGIVLKLQKTANRHIKMHDESISFKCQLCPSKFRSSSNLKDHMDKHEGKPRYRCEHCDRAFYSKPVLIKHRRTHTGEKPYVCNICGRGFTGNHNLKVHMKIHGLDVIKKKKQELIKVEKID